MEVNKEKETIYGDSIRSERSDSPQNQYEYQKSKNIKRWIQLFDWAQSLKKKSQNEKS
jgi:hypothetical protein